MEYLKYTECPYCKSRINSSYTRFTTDFKILYEKVIFVCGCEILHDTISENTNNGCPIYLIEKERNRREKELNDIMKFIYSENISPEMKSKLLSFFGELKEDINDLINFVYTNNLEVTVKKRLLDFLNKIRYIYGK